ncbi:winged helix-turn-helix domain-containing protein [Bradyrhizobium sp. SZCCHNRI20481]|uniref:winged helix-turn-helix domain-containing protein n=1 Tax=Bradyrhizobium sp. SZCCHNRI20481 TaxID=3057286 RepID=UPI003966C40E
MDLRAQLVYRNARRIKLGPLEFHPLEHFLRHARCVFSRKELLKSVWGRNLHIVTRTTSMSHVCAKRAMRQDFLATCGRSRRAATTWTIPTSAAVIGVAPLEKARILVGKGIIHNKGGTQCREARAMHLNG